MKQTQIIGIYYVQCGVAYSFEETLDIICCEESIGIESITYSNHLKIFPGISGLSEDITKAHKASYKIKHILSSTEGIVEISFPVYNILQNGSLINSIFSTLMGDLFGIDAVENIRLLDIEFPESVISLFPGAKFGKIGVQSLLGSSPPYIGVIAKPNIGMTPKELGKLVYQLSTQGVDFIKDDELMMSPVSCPLVERTKYVRDALERANAITKKRTLYAINISGDGRNTLENAHLAVENGANCLMLNVFTTGFAHLAELAACKELNVPIHSHRCMHDIFTSNAQYGVASNVFGKLIRLCGADFYHIGIFAGKNDKKVEEMLQVYNQLTNNNCPLPAVIPIVSRSSLLSIDITKQNIPSLDVLFLICGSYYRSRQKERVIEALKDKIKSSLNNQLPNQMYEDCVKELLDFERGYK